MKAEVAPDCADTGAPGGLELVSQKCRRANVAAVSSGSSLCVLSSLFFPPLRPRADVSALTSGLQKSLIVLPSAVEFRSPRLGVPRSIFSVQRGLLDNRTLLVP